MVLEAGQGFVGLNLGEFLNAGVRRTATISCQIWKNVTFIGWVV